MINWNYLASLFNFGDYLQLLQFLIMLKLNLALFE